MYSSKLLKRLFYHFRLGREIFVFIFVYFIFFIIAQIFWPKNLNFEYFSILNQLLLPLLSCMWMSACVREWIEGDNKEILFFYSNSFFFRQLADIFLYQILIVLAYVIPCYYGNELWSNVLIEMIVCFLFQTIYCLGMLLFNSSALVLFVVVIFEIINAMAYLKNVGNGWYLFLKYEEMSAQLVWEKYIWFLIISLFIWGIYLILYWQKKKKGKLWG